LRPTIISLQVSNVRDGENNTRSADAIVQLNLTVDPGQLIVLILNEWSVERPTSYTFKAAARQEETTEVIVPVEGVKAGEYLARVQIDGAESLLNYDTDPNSPTFNWYVDPRISI
jgi:hypothetical protein